MRTSFYHLLEFCDPRRKSAAGRSETAARPDRPPTTLSDHTPQPAIKPDVYLRISCDIPAISLISCTFGRIVGQFHHSAVDWQVAERQKGYAGWSLLNIFLTASVILLDIPVASSLETGGIGQGDRGNHVWRLNPHVPEPFVHHPRRVRRRSIVRGLVKKQV